MIEIFENLLELINHNRDSVLVTVIESTGSTPREKGTRMLVAKGGRICGTIGGGKIEYLAEEQGKICLEEKRSCIKEYNLAPNEVADLGMICGGQVKVLFQYLNPRQDELAKICTTIIDYINTNQHFWLLSSLKEFSYKNEMSSNIELTSNGGLTSRSELNLMYEIQQRPIILIHENVRSIGELKPGFSEIEIPELGRHFVEEFSQKGKVFIFGGGHVAQALVPVLRDLDFYCVVLEDREDFLTVEQFPTANERILVDFDSFNKGITITDKDYAVVVTRSHQFDYEIQKQLLSTPIYYIGVMGSKNKTATQKNMLREEGYTEEEIGRLNMPIGIKIKAETVKELAISISGELILKRAI
jgi:xanthine dehydrogenase accessory factor